MKTITKVVKTKEELFKEAFTFENEVSFIPFKDNVVYKSFTTDEKEVIIYFTYAEKNCIVAYKYGCEYEIDNYLGFDRNPNSYAFFRWICEHCVYVNEETYWYWCSNDCFDESYYKLYLKYLMEVASPVSTQFFSDVVETIEVEETLAEKLRRKLSDVKFDTEKFKEALTHAFYTSHSGIWITLTDTIYSERGFAYTYNSFFTPFIIFINRNDEKKVLELLNKEGFSVQKGKFLPNGANSYLEGYCISY